MRPWMTRLAVLCCAATIVLLGGGAVLSPAPGGVPAATVDGSFWWVVDRPSQTEDCAEGVAVSPLEADATVTDGVPAAPSPDAVSPCSVQSEQTCPASFVALAESSVSLSGKGVTALCQGHPEQRHS